MPPLGKPKITDAQTDLLARHFFGDNEPAVVVIGVRGYFKDTLGKKGANDWNLYDDAFLVRAQGDLLATFNANVDPSRQRANQAQLVPGLYHFYRGQHKGRIRAFRAYPEGVKLRCKRQQADGWEYDAYCQYINIHDGGLNDTWSLGCQTAPGAKAASVWGNQFAEFRDLVYRLMDQHACPVGALNSQPVKLLTYLLVDEAQVKTILEGSKS
jgi:hypothetical protein